MRLSFATIWMLFEWNDDEAGNALECITLEKKDPLEFASYGGHICVRNKR